MGSDASLLVGVLGGNVAELSIDELDRHGLSGHLRIAGQPGGDGTFDAPLVSVPGAEADVLAGLTFDGAPLRVYLGFVEPAAGDSALAVVSLYDDSRVELRVLRGSPNPLYGIFALARAEPDGAVGARWPGEPRGASSASSASSVSAASSAPCASCASSASSSASASSAPLEPSPARGRQTVPR